MKFIFWAFEGVYRDGYKSGINSSSKVENAILRSFMGKNFFTNSLEDQNKNVEYFFRIVYNY